MISNLSAKKESSSIKSKSNQSESGKETTVIDPNDMNDDKIANCSTLKLYIFDKYDENNDGYLSKDELKKLLEDTGHENVN